MIFYFTSYLTSFFLFFSHFSCSSPSPYPINIRVPLDSILRSLLIFFVFNLCVISFSPLAQKITYLQGFRDLHFHTGPLFWTPGSCRHLLTRAFIWKSIITLKLDIGNLGGRVVFPGGSDGKESVCNAGGLSFVPGLGRSPGEGNDNPPQCSCLRNLMDRGAWQATELQRVEHD